MENASMIETIRHLFLQIMNRNHSEAGSHYHQERGELLNRQQVKDYLQISEATYKRKVRSGELVPMRMPGGHRYYRNDLEDAFRESIRRGRI